MVRSGGEESSNFGLILIGLLSVRECPLSFFTSIIVDCGIPKLLNVDVYVCGLNNQMHLHLAPHENVLRQEITLGFFTYYTSSVPFS